MKKHAIISHLQSASKSEDEIYYRTSSSDPIKKNNFQFKIKLNVPYKDKDIAKSYGALWYANYKLWYAKKLLTLHNLEPWFSDSIYLIGNFGVAETSRKCWKSHHETTVIALYCTNTLVKNPHWQIEYNPDLLVILTTYH